MISPPSFLTSMITCALAALAYALIAGFEGRLGGVSIYPVRPRAGAPASRVLMRGVKGSRAPLALLKGLDLHDASGAFTPEADAIFRGKASIDW